MNKKLVRRIAAAFTAAVIGAGAICMFAACTSDHPQVTITYTFNGNDYAVGYELSREDAPETVQHFIELADAGFYDGTVIHNYDTNFLYGGGYTIEEGMLQEKDYFTFVKEYEEEHDYKFTQTVFKTDGTTPLYTVVGEFPDAGRGPETSHLFHTKGALVMYYNSFKNFSYDVLVERADGGKGNDGEKMDRKSYLYNSTTSLFYTFLGQTDFDRDQSYAVLGKTNLDLDDAYAVFGKTKDYDGELAPLIDAVNAYSEGLDEGKPFATPYADFPETLYLFSLVQKGDDDFEALQKNSVEAEDFNTPLDMPIVVTSVKVTKY